MTSFPVRRKLAVLPFALLPLGVLAGCGGENSETNCSVNACTVTFDRGVDASASILGVKAELVKVEGQMVTLKIGGQTVTVPVGEGEQAEGFDVSVQSVTKDQVVVKISNNG
ncbi:hypothetical protein [Actinomadura madurae]|uniref:hypothetical protein n=1 Tax=Actinomadura madurae TaxID=1993 RepID=UPI002025E477|nr:hypothetical protein [Actinomadura madurae]MCP9955004.1 hypothetical protein [Actinomadura madurae]MCQ0004207.1 hypothetical protein [Actinomadura madurae]MCQ0020443.1 hypothetical protein [Actinomadura madurae]URN00480.1 hypothetical protein LUW76_42695 [Actinomadura madurae]URN02636.1 hypothetical protein LUW74_04165 [Actinomadura madurae]